MLTAFTKALKVSFRRLILRDFTAASALQKPLRSESCKVLKFVSPSFLTRSVPVKPVQLGDSDLVLFGSTAQR
jgi:hypothetical protein